MPHRIRVLAILIVLGAAGGLRAGTPLIDLETGSSLVSNFKARKVGDVVTIIITEKTTADATTEMDANSKSEISGGPALGFLQPFGSWGLDTENKYQGDGATSRTGNLRGEISVTITEVLPNGNFRLTGNRAVDINGDRQLIEICGVCRPRDIAPDNTILSTYISEAQIAYSGTGLAQDAAEPGILTRIVNWLF
ncbi:MAG TPA: flagellar basal body L-ring protein FlgH [Candidatus Krumholzibacteria bacterium]|nr:flagellar basal body L-ring protein FlgH [Candidatus Krumholzibacteria bacterium]HPD71659.1 flagellar basal body L-ring protein FlgH [Candidatus Krumholzibacteria bacterium]HRY41408.1 flagellar basal body L-ring protein FlgH [Candidatus Krumholzibacteria bacterium]